MQSCSLKPPRFGHSHIIPKMATQLKVLLQTKPAEGLLYTPLLAATVGGGGMQLPNLMGQLRSELSQSQA